MEVKLSLKFNKRLVLSLLAVAGLAALLFGIYRVIQSKNPLPPDIKKQLSFAAIYPGDTKSIDANSYSYKTDDKSLSYELHLGDKRVAITEQPAPESLVDPGQIYYQSLGVRPYAQFQSRLGPVALVKFYEAGTLKAQGQTAILSVKGMLLLAHPDKDLTNAEWKNFFNSLKVSR